MYYAMVPHVTYCDTCNDPGVMTYCIYIKQLLHLAQGFSFIVIYVVLYIFSIQKVTTEGRGSLLAALWAHYDS